MGLDHNLALCLYLPSFIVRGFMSRKCDITNKRKQRGSIVSHSNNKSLKAFEVNLHKKRVFDSETGKWVTIKVSARGLRTLNKKGISAILREQRA